MLPYTSRALLQEPEPIDILLVDDREQNLLALEATLSSSDYHLIRAESGDAALRYLLDHEPALILMDVQMPELDGFETTEMIKQNERTRDIPIIFITAIDQDERYLRHGYERGAVDYIYKPYDAGILRSKVAVFADLARKNRRLLQMQKSLHENERTEREQQICELEVRNLRREQADQKKYRDLVEGIDHGIVWSAAADTLAVSFVSPSAEKILGFPVERWFLEPEFFIKHVFEEDRESILSALRDLKAECSEPYQRPVSSIRIEHRMYRSDGSVAWIQSAIKLTSQNDDSRMEIRVLSLDITKTKEAEAVLQKSKLRSDFMAEASLLLSESLDYETILSRIGQLAVPRLACCYMIDVSDPLWGNKPIAIAHFDPAKAAVLNELHARFPFEAYPLVGIERVLRTGKSELYSSVTDDIVKQWACTTEHFEALMSIRPRSVIVIPLTVRDTVRGTMILVSTRAEHRYDEADLFMAEDLARRAASAIENARLYWQAQEAIRARDEFLSIASHELKTPLTPLKLQIQSLMRVLETGDLASLKPEKASKLLQISERQLNKLSKLIDDLLDVSRIGVGQLVLHPESFNLIELAQDVVDRFCVVMSENRCEIIAEVPKPFVVRWDRFRIEQVLINLLTNAIKYGPGKPVQLAIRSIQDSEGVENVALSFIDQGIGIAKKDQGRIFSRFERAVSGNHFGGLGLGLYIVRQIVQQHGGVVSVESELGHGSTFKVEIPRFLASSQP